MRLVKWNDLITAYEKDPKPSSKSFYTIIFLLILLVLIPLSFGSIQKQQIIKLYPQEIQPAASLNPIDNPAKEIVPEVKMGFNFKSEDSNGDGAVNSLDYLNSFDKGKSEEECAPVLTRACGIVECKNFPTSCDIPEGWIVEKPCETSDQCGLGYVCDFDGFCRKSIGEVCDTDWQCVSDSMCSAPDCQAGFDCSTGLSCIKRQN